MSREVSIPPRPSDPSRITMSALRRLRTDESGAIMVIAVFMAACLVGCIWYMFGLGEAMVYRQQLRAAADATAFKSAVIQAVGMNDVAMINVAMAVVLGFLVLLQLIFFILVIITIVDALLLLIPGVDIFAGADLVALVNADTFMFNWIQKVQKPIFVTLTVLNGTSGVVAIVMPWVAHISSHGTPNDYGPAAHEGGFFQPFSWSMIPNRLPFVSNYFETTMGTKFMASATKKLPILGKLKDNFGVSINPAKLATSRYGLPVQDDKYPVLCLHAAEQVVSEASLLIGTILSQETGGKINGGELSGALGGFTYWFGVVVGSFPGLFCSGTEPMVAAAKEVGIGAEDIAAVGGQDALTAFFALLKPFSGWGWYKSLRALSEASKKATSQPLNKNKSDLYRYSMYPMKPYDLFQNGNGFGQVFAIIDGNESLTTGAATGVDVAKWGPSAAFSGDTAGNSVDYAEAEFYYDCGPGSGTSAPGRNDTLGKWDQCKYNATWNLKWKARLRRYHPFQLDALKMGELALYNALGAESIVQKMLGYVPGLDGYGLGAKYGVVDAIKSCLTGIGQGKPGALSTFGRCPIPTGGSSGGGTVTIGWESNAPGISNYNNVLH
jgi:hypothetical protein